MILNLNWRNRIRRIRDFKTNKALVLMYHRVAELSVDPWQLAVSPINFERQLRILKKNYNLISVNGLTAQLEKKSLSPNGVCITFDDGYCDNYITAKPLLEKYECPAVFFVSSHYINQKQSFWWDELQEVILGSEKLPASLSITVNEKPFNFRLKNDGILTNEERERQKSWVAIDRAPTERCELFLSLYNSLRPLQYSEIESVIEELKSWGNYKKVVGENLPMTNRQLKDISAKPLFDVALHTATHPALSFHPREIQFEEIAQNERDLKNNCQRMARALAYPHGEYNKTTLSVAAEHGLTAAFTTEEKPVTKRSDIYRLGRFQVNDWNADEFETRLSKWKRDY